MTHAEALATVERMLRDDPDLNLWLLAFENPDLEDAALEIANDESIVRRVFDETT